MKDISFPSDLYSKSGFHPHIDEFLDLVLLFDDKTMTKKNSESGVGVLDMVPLFTPAPAPVYVDKSTTIIETGSRESRTRKEKVDVKVEEAKGKGDKEKEDKVEGDKDDKEKKKDSSGLIIAVAAGSLALASTYLFARRQGELEFLKNYELMLTEPKRIITDTQLWMYERQRLEMSVPKLVESDVQSLLEIIGLVERLDQRPELEYEKRSFGLLSICGILLLASTKCKPLRYVGAGGVGLLAVEYVYRKGMYSSSRHADLRRVLEQRCKRIVNGLRNQHVSRLKVLVELS